MFRIIWILAAVLFAPLVSADAVEGQQVHASAGGPATLVIDAASGRVLQRSGDVDVAALPGSVLKPFLLLTALRSGAVREREAIACRGTLVIRGHNLACSHPRDVTVLDARQALAESCNTYFATIAERMRSATLMAGLHAFGFRPVREPRDGDERALTALGLQNVMVTPIQMAGAYRQLAEQMNANEKGDAKVLREGLIASVQTGMASAARAQGVTLGGKTGTVDDAGGRSHGWFAGLVFTGPDALTAERVVVTFVPNGNGADAATLARAVLRREAGR